MKKIQITKKLNERFAKKLEKPDFTELEKLVDDYIHFLSSPNYHEDKVSDYRHYAFQAAVEAFYGKNVWNDYVNKCMK